MGHRPSLRDRLTASTHNLDAAQLRSDVERMSCTSLADVARGEVVTVAGRLRAVVYNPSDTVPTLEAQLFDGTAFVDLVWLGQRRIAGIEPGRRIKASGRVGVHGGQLAIYNPYYELQGGA
ncbi:MAG: OB-fold nucleic acid binding domain-containing protein [Actinomycetota bacterium]|nr:OB-fold nucleic acid binding domain-containing protein [Actinomycetota bacterium]